MDDLDLVLRSDISRSAEESANLPDFTTIAHRGARRRRRRTVAAVVAAAVAVAAFLGSLQLVAERRALPAAPPSTTLTPTTPPKECPTGQAPDCGPTPDGKDSQPVGPSPTPIENPMANGDLVRAEEYFARALEPCTVVTDGFLADPKADCSIRAEDVDVAAGVGLFQEFPTEQVPAERLQEHPPGVGADTGNDPASRPVVTLRVTTRQEVLGRFASPYQDFDAELGPGEDEISLAHDREITVVGFDGSRRRSIDLSAAVALAGESIRGVAWSPDGTHAAVVSGTATAEGVSKRIWIVDQNGGQAQLVHALTNTKPVPGARPLAYIWSETWSPDGRSIGFIEELASIASSEYSQSIKAVTLNVAGTGASAPKTLYTYTTTPYDQAQILWSPDGARVALRVPEQVLEVSVEDGRLLDRHAMIAGRLVWIAKPR